MKPVLSTSFWSTRLEIMSTKQLYWTDAHFCGLRSQTNVYSLAKITSLDGHTKLLAGSVNGQFISVEYQKYFNNRLIPITKEQQLFSTSTTTGLGGETEVVSVDVICKNDSKQSVIVGITYLQLEAHYEIKPPNAFMNIYHLPEKNEEVTFSNVMEAIAQSDVQNLGLEFIPFQLTHHILTMDDSAPEVCFLLSGNDMKIHLYRQCEDYPLFKEDVELVEKYFPEFANIESSVTVMELKVLDDSRRLTALGHQNGYVSLSIVNIHTKERLNVWNTCMDSPITSLKLFSQYTNTPCPDFLDLQEESREEKEVMHLLITSAIDPSAVFHDVVTQGLTKSRTLPLSNTQDVVLCSCVIDIDFDGENEILIGTYGQVLLAYKLVYEKPETMTSTPFHSPMPISLTGDLPTPPSESERSRRGEGSAEQDQRRRHKSMATLQDSSDNLTRQERHDRHRSDEVSTIEGTLRDSQIGRLVRSQENLASPSPRSSGQPTPEYSTGSELTLPQNMMPDIEEYPCYRLKWTKRFCDPLMGLLCDDVMGDGMLDLVVLTLKGLHILQPDLNEVAGLVLERMKLLCDPGSDTDDAYHQLQTEMLDTAH